MDVFTIDKLFIFIAFIVPGFVSLKAYEIFVPTQKIDSSKILIEAITYWLRQRQYSASVDLMRRWWR
jgi:hypothetical protein